MRQRLAAVVVTGGLFLTLSVFAADRVLPGPLATGEIRLPNGRLLTPTGTQIPVASYPFAIALTPDGRRLVVASTGTTNQTLQLVDAKAARILAEEPLPPSWLGLVLSPDGLGAYVAGAGGRNVLVYRLDGDRIATEGAILLTAPGDVRKDASPSGLALSKDGRTLWAARLVADDLVRVDLATRSVTAVVPVGRHPYRPVLSPDGLLLAVGNWGGASVALVDPLDARVLATVPTDDHPCDLTFSGDGRTLFVAEANRNRVAVIDVASRKVIRQISVALGPDGPGTPSADSLPDGSTPNALALSPDGRTLFVADADDDAVAVVDVPAEREKARAVGFIPSGWYPAALALSADGKTLFVANGKGSGSRANAADGPSPTGRPEEKSPGYIPLFPGSVSRLSVPRGKELDRLTARCYANRRPGALAIQPAESRVLPSRPAESSPIRHVIYVIRENRTYDQVFGDVARGNGDPGLAILGRDITPNAHALADQFVLLDNFYADAEVSADGHNWSMGAYATDFTEKLWPPNYGKKGFDYWFEGDDPTAFPTAGYLWDAASRAGLTLRNYGEFVGVPETASKPAYTGTFEGKEGALKDSTCPFYPGFDLEILDNARVDLWLKEFREYEKKKEFPRLMIVRLGTDHTAGTRKGARTPRAMVYDNDLALGRLVEAVSRSGFWKETAIFAVEDDAQNGADHVDAHRTVALVVSPFTRRGGFVDSTLYSTVSMLRTMELILGLSPMSQHDATATPMANAFMDVPDATPFTHVEGHIPLYETNPDGAPMQGQAATWNLHEADEAPEMALNEAIWKSLRGADAVMPAPVNAAFVRAGESER